MRRAEHAPHHLSDQRDRYRRGVVDERVRERACRRDEVGRRHHPADKLAGKLVSRVVPPADLIPTARALAHAFIDNTAPVSVALIRQMMWRMLGASHPMEAHRIDSKAMFDRGRSADVKEGIMSFLEKRAPHFADTVSRHMP